MRDRLMKLMMIIFGNVMIAFAVAVLLLDNHIIAGGISGIGVVMNHYIHLPVSITVGVINVILFILGWTVMDKEFVMKSLLSSVVFPIMLGFFQDNPMFKHVLDDPLLAAVLAGCLIGIGIGLVIRSGGSTGGIDIIALCVNKKTNAPTHIVMNFIDLTILLLQMSFHDITHVTYGIVTIVLTAFMMNKALSNGRQLAQIMVISDAYEQMKQVILNQGDAGLTFIETEKGYSGEKSKLILTVVPYNKLPMLKQMIKRIDQHAFIVVSHVDEVGGRGFSLER